MRHFEGAGWLWKWRLDKPLRSGHGQGAYYHCDITAHSGQPPAAAELDDVARAAGDRDSGVAEQHGFDVKEVQHGDDVKEIQHGDDVKEIQHGDDVTPPVIFSREGVLNYVPGCLDVLLQEQVSRAVTFDPMTATPTYKFAIHPETASSKEPPFITSLVVDAPSSRVFMADMKNRRLKHVDLRVERTGRGRRGRNIVVEDVELRVAPFGMALLADDGRRQLAVTSRFCNVITVLNVTRTCDEIEEEEGGGEEEERTAVAVAVARTFRTARLYWGICALGDGTLAVSCSRDAEFNNRTSASVDIITTGGDLVRTVVDSAAGSLASSFLKSPDFLCLQQGQGQSQILVVSDSVAHCLLRLDAAAGQLIDTLTHAKLKRPWQVCSDRAGNVYVPSYYGNCVLVVTPTGQWRVLPLHVHGKSREGEREEGEEETGGRPQSLAVTDAGLLVVSSEEGHFTAECVVRGYGLVR